MNAAGFRAALRTFLAAELAQPLEDAEDHTSLMQLGVDSMIATTLIEHIRREWLPDAKVSILFDHPDIADLAEHLARHAKVTPVTEVEVKGASSLPGSAPLASTSGSLDIAVIGVSVRLPDAPTLEALWGRLMAGHCAIRGIPAERAAYWSTGMDGAETGPACRHGAFLADIDRFDAEFFNVSPREAALMDPQQRLFLEEAWKALEDAGCSAESLRHARCGVYAGVMNTDYQDLLARGSGTALDAFELMGTSASILAARIAYYLKLRGPALAVDTACSSSLTAIDLACRALRRGELDLALAGAVTLYLTERRFRLMEMVGMLSSTGECRPFDDRADGTVTGECVGVVILKRLEDALRDGDAIHGVIRSSGINQAAPTDGITVPSMEGQRELLAAVQRAGGVDPDSIQYLEAHGTGTKLGDPIEAEALARQFGTGRRAAPLWVGSIKANLGHAAAAAGMAGLGKILLALRHGIIPPQIRFEVPNGHLGYADLPFRIPTTAQPWSRPEGGARRAALTSLGFSGLNAHLIIDEPPAPTVPGTDAGDVWIVLSGRTTAALQARAEDLERWVVQQAGAGWRLVDLAATLATGRTAFEERAAFRARHPGEVRQGLAAVREAAAARGEGRSDVDPLPGVEGWVGRAAKGLAGPSGDQAVAWPEAGRHWVGGGSVAWNDHYRALAPGRLHLPAYRFAEDRWWANRPSVSPVAVAPPATPAPLVPMAAASTQASIPAGDGPATSRVRLRHLPPGAAAAPVSVAGLPTAPEELSDATAPVRRPPSAAGQVSAPAPAARPVGIDVVELQAKLSKLLSAVLFLGERRADPDKRFADLGLDSILAVEFARKISAEFAVPISAAVLYNHPNLRQLATHLGAILAGKVSATEGTAARYFGADLSATGPEVVPVAPVPPRLEVRTAEEDTIPGLARRTPPRAAVAECRSAAPAEAWRPLAVRAVRGGEVEDLEFAELRLGSPGPGQVQVEIHAASVMMADLLCARGLYPSMPPYPFTTGFEMAGIVVEVGPEVAQLKPGDRVFGLTGAALGGHASRINVDATQVALMPPGWSFAEAASVPVSYLTAFHALVEVGRLKSGEVLLITSAGSCTGLMAIQIARRLGARIRASAGSADRAERLRELGVEEAWDYSTEGSGPADVDVVLNLVAGPVRDRALQRLKPGGRFLDLCVGALKASPPADLSRLVDGQGYFGIDARKRSLREPEWVGRGLARGADSFAQGVLVPLPVSRKFSLEEIHRALHDLARRDTLGRVVVLPREQAPTVERAGTPWNAFASAVRAMKPAPVLGAPGGETIQIPGRREPIAIVGMAGRFAGARTVEELWGHLSEGRDLFTEVGPERWRGTDDGRRWRGGWLAGWDTFDAGFFGMAPAEAAQLDPQHRCLLQEAWHALEDFGHPPSSLAGSRGGVFIGIVPSEYLSRLGTPEAHSLPGNLGSGLAGRLAYLLDWSGPCLAVDTACSSSFTALHLACTSLWSGECEVALVGGVHVASGPSMLQGVERMGLISPTGSCRVLDAAADGWLPGEGAGAVVLKRLKDALRDGDRIHAVIRSCGINQDGAKNGFIAPKAAAQTALQRRVYAEAGVRPEDLGYVELHGLATRLGDEVELMGLRETFAGVAQPDFCVLGTLKPNVGHPVAAAGIACVLKVVSMLQHRRLPPLIGIAQLNESLGLQEGPFRLLREGTVWNSAGPRRAAINGLSATGTNFHAVMEEWIAPDSAADDGSSPEPVMELLVLSARTPAQLRDVARDLAEHLRKASPCLGDLAYTLQRGRDALPFRLAFPAENLTQARSVLEGFIDGRFQDGVITGEVEGRGTVASLMGGPAGEQFVATLLDQRDLVRLAGLWTAGVRVDWRRLHRVPRRRIALPGYPFDTTIYWGPAGTPAPGAAVSPVRLNPPRSATLFEEVRECVAEVLGCPAADLDSRRDLRKAGFGSLYVLRLTQRLAERTGRQVPPSAFYECATLDALAEQVALFPVSMAAAPAAASGAGEGALTEGQRALWNWQISHPTDPAYIIPVAIERPRAVDPVHLGQALESLSQVHGALRTWFATPGSGHEPVARVASAVRIPVTAVVWKTPGDDLAERLQRLAGGVIDLGTAPLLRAWAVTAGDRHFMVLSFHHLIVDGSSLEVLLRQLEQALEVLEAGGIPAPHRPAVDFSAVVSDEQAYLASPAAAVDRGYWLEQLPRGMGSPLFPGRSAAGGANRPGGEHTRGGNGHAHAVSPENGGAEEPGRRSALLSRHLTADWVSALSRLANENRVSLQALALAAYGVVLGRRAGGREVVIGVAADARTHSAFREVVGYAINLLPVRLDWNVGASLGEVARTGFRRCLEALEHRRLPFRRIARALAERDGPESAHELQAAWYFQTWSDAAGRQRATRMVSGVHQQGEFPVVFEWMEAEDGARLQVTYQTARLSRSDAEALASEWFALLDAAVTAGVLDQVPVAERGAAEFPFPREPVHRWIERTARRRGDAVAVAFQEQTLSYRALDERAHRLAHRLVGEGVRPGSLVGVLLERTLDLPVVLLAVWKAGAAYVPLDPSYPVERLQQILEDGRVPLLLAHRSLSLDIANLPVRRVDLETLEAVESPIPPGPPAEGGIGIESAAYVIFTSGSTGRPKGVEVSHRGLSHFLACMERSPGCTETDRVLALTTIAFDIAALELFLPLVTGGVVEIVSAAVARSGVRLKQHLEKSSVTLVQGTPATWRMLLAAELGPMPRARALCGGEAWDTELAGQLLQRFREVWNMYGPTETTVWSSVHRVEPGGSLHLGDPIGNTRFYVLDELLKPVPKGEIGELYIGGDGLASGYRHRPDLTRERFLAHPEVPGEVIYRTGDLVRHV